MDTPICTNSAGFITYKLNGTFHRVDGPALIYEDGSEEWYQHGLCHRVDGPALIYVNGYRAWYQNDRVHRTDGPAVIYPDGKEEYWLDGKEVDVIVHFLQRT